MASMQNDLVVERPSSLRDQVVGNLRQGIISGRFAPGERLVERRMRRLVRRRGPCTSRV